MKMTKIFATNKLKILRSKSTTLALILLLTVSATFMTLSVVKAHDPPLSIKSYAYLSVAPDPVGIGQTIFMNMYHNLAPPTAGGLYQGQVIGDRWEGFTITITKPDDTTVVLGPFTSDATGGTYTTYVADQLGEWDFKFDFPGQTLDGGDLPPPYNIAGGSGEMLGDYFEPASATASITVQQEQVEPYPQTPLPTDYWQRPIYAMNTEWWRIGGNWLGLSATNFHTTGIYNRSGNFAPYTTAPNSPHIIWTRPMKFGGQIGGEPYGGDQTTQFVSTSQYQPFYGPIIIAGRLYYQEFPGSKANPTGWNCIDLRTGELIWHKKFDEEKDLVFGQILEYESINQYGAYAYLWARVDTKPPNIDATYAIHDAWTGEWIADIVNASAVSRSGSGTPGFTWQLDTRNCPGSILGYYTETTPTGEKYLTLWNSTACILSSGPGAGIPIRYRTPDPHGQWWAITPGGEIDFSLGIEWSVPIPTTLNNKNISLGIRDITPDVILFSYNPGTYSVFAVPPGWYVFGAASARDGHWLWGPFNYTVNPYTYFSSGPTANEVWTTYDRDTFEWNAYSLLTGQKIWGPKIFPHNVWCKYGMRPIAGYGNIYAVGFGGYVNCIDIKTGELKWSYFTGGAGYDTPFGVHNLWTFQRVTLADGKIYCGEGMEYSPPLWRGAQGICIDAFTGELVYSVLGFYAEGPPAIADGIMVVDNSYDMLLYAFAPGRTATTVTTKQDVIALGESALIQGTVTDQSPGQTCLGIPAAGTPAIGEAYMKPWMEYLYMQQPMPQNATGVPVIVQAMDSAGNLIDIGTVTSDAFGNFKVAFCPDKEDVYTILASFLGSDSYYASYASTGLAVGPAPEEIVIPEPPEPEPAADYTPMFLALIAAVAVAIIIGLVNLFRRK